MNVLESFSLKGKVALVTGGAGLYGRQIVEALAEAGAETYIASRNLESLQQVAKEEVERGHNVTAMKLDLSQDDSIENLHRDIIEKSGKCDIFGIICFQTFRMSAIRLPRPGPNSKISAKSGWPAMSYMCAR